MPMYAPAQFYLMIPAGAVLAAVGWLVLVFGQFGASTADGHWILAVQDAKVRAAEAAPAGGRLLLVGGESVHFGLNAAALSSVVERPVLNLGTHQAVGLDYMLDRVEPLLRRGDRVLLMLEYEMFAHPEAAARIARDALLAEGWALFGRYADRLEVILDLVLETDARRILDGYLPPLAPPDGLDRYAADAIAPSGDATGTGPTRRDPERWRRSAAAAPAFLPVTPLPEAGLAALRRFVDRARGLEITVVAAWPALQVHAGFGQRDYRDFFAAVAAAYAAVGVPVLGTPEVFIRPVDSYLAGPYQVHAKARLDLTRALAVGLARETDWLDIDALR